jgi:hypothetical protein
MSLFSTVAVGEIHQGRLLLCLMNGELGKREQEKGKKEHGFRSRRF